MCSEANMCKYIAWDQYSVQSNSNYYLYILTKILFLAILKQHQCKHFCLFSSSIIDFLCFSPAFNGNEAGVTGQVPKKGRDLCAGSFLESALRSNSYEEIEKADWFSFLEKRKIELWCSLSNDFSQSHRDL